MRYRDMRVVCTTPTQHAACVASGLPADGCLLVRPAVQVEQQFALTRADIRARLGLAEDDFVLLAPGESTLAAAHEMAVWTGSILHVTDDRYRVLLWGRGRRLQAAAGLGRKLRQHGLAVSASNALGASVEFAEILPAADAVLVAPRAPAATLPVAMAMAAGVPVVAVERPDLAELLIDGVTAYTAQTAAPRLLAQRVLDLRADADAAQRISANARRRAGELFAVQAFVLAYRSLYASLASEGAVTPAGRTSPQPSDLSVESRT
jgi:glycosyltransferase involved in cell wall biosynthesis